MSIDYNSLPDGPADPENLKEIDRIIAEAEGSVITDESDGLKELLQQGCSTGFRGHMFSDMLSDDYHAHPALSRSALWAFKQLPQKYYYQYLSGAYERPDDSQSLILGSAVHTLVLEPHLFDEQYYTFTKINRTTKAGKEAYTQAMEEAAGRTLLSEQEYAQCLAMRESIYANPMIKTLFDNAENPLVEHSILWNCPVTGLQLKCRPDLITGPMVLDLKTTRDASYRAFQGSAFKFGYFMQAAMIYEGFKAYYGEGYQSFVFLCVEPNPPYSVGIYVLDGEALQVSLNQLGEVLDQYKRCFDANVWPGYQIQALTLPNYANYETPNFEVTE